MATKKETKNFFVTGVDGKKRRLTFKTNVDPTAIQSDVDEIEIPEPLYHELKTVVGIEKQLIDSEETAAQISDEVLEQYKQNFLVRKAAESKQMMVMLRTIFLEVVSVDDLPDEGWNKNRRIKKLSPITDPDEYRVAWLMSVTTMEEKMEIMSRATRNMGVDEEVIANAEKTFRDNLEGIEESRDLEDA